MFAVIYDEAAPFTMEQFEHLRRRVMEHGSEDRPSQPSGSPIGQQRTNRLSDINKDPIGKVAYGISDQCARPSLRERLEKEREALLYRANKLQLILEMLTPEVEITLRVKEALDEMRIFL